MPFQVSTKSEKFSFEFRIIIRPVSSFNEYFLAFLISIHASVLLIELTSMSLLKERSNNLCGTVV